MIFTKFCTGFAITILIAAVTLLLDHILSDSHNENGIFAWLINSFGFGICLTILLYQNGVIK